MQGVQVSVELSVIVRLKLPDAKDETIENAVNEELEYNFFTLDESQVEVASFEIVDYDILYKGYSQP